MSSIFHRVALWWYRLQLERCKRIRYRIEQKLDFCKKEIKTARSLAPEEAENHIHGIEEQVSEAEKLQERIKRIAFKAEAIISKCPGCRAKLEASKRKLAFQKAMRSPHEIDDR